MTEQIILDSLPMTCGAIYKAIPGSEYVVPKLLRTRKVIQEWHDGLCFLAKPGQIPTRRVGQRGKNIKRTPTGKSRPCHKCLEFRDECMFANYLPRKPGKICAICRTAERRERRKKQKAKT